MADVWPQSQLVIPDTGLGLGITIPGLNRQNLCLAAWPAVMSVGPVLPRPVSVGYKGVIFVGLALV